MDLAPDAGTLLNSSLITEKPEVKLKPKRNKFKRRSLSLGEKLSIIVEIEGGKNKNKVADDKQIPRSTVCSIWDNRHKIKSANAIHGRHDGCKRLRPSEYDEVDQALYRWWLHATDKGMLITTNILIEKAQSFAQSLGVQLKKCNSWMDRFKIRHGLKGKSHLSEIKRVDPLGRRDEFVKELPSLTLDKNYRDIYCVNEIGLLYHVLPDVNEIINGTTQNFGSNKRMTILLGTNMDGSDLLPPLVIGNNRDLQSLGNPESLSVSYAYNRSSLLTALIWRDWINAFDRRMQSLQRHVILFTHASPFKFTASDLRAVEVKFVPTKSTAFMPTKQGIMQRFKTWYRKLVLRDMVDSMNDGVEFTLDTVSVLHFIRKAWDHITQDCVLNSFKVAGWTWDENYVDNINHPDPTPCLSNECYKLNISESVLSEVDIMEENMTIQEELTDQVIIDSIALQQQNPQFEAIEEVEEEEEHELNNKESENRNNNVTNGCGVSSSDAKSDLLVEAKDAMKILQTYFESLERDSKTKPKSVEPRRKSGKPKKRAEKKVVQKGKRMSLNPEKGVFEMTMTKIIKMEENDEDLDLDLEMEC